MQAAQQLDNLLNGISQRPQEQRSSSQAETQKNGFSSLVRGLMKRPPRVHLGQLTSTITGWATAFVHSINRDANERYHVAIANGDVLVYNALTQAPVTVIAPQGKSYLTDAAGKGFRAATAGDTTIIVNRGVKALRGTKKTAAAKFEALVYVRQADFATTYQVTLNDVPVGLQTVAAVTAQSREQISTEKIATDLYTVLKAEPLLSSFTFTRYGSTIYITRADGQDFKLSVFDGLSDKGLKAVKGSVQDFLDLPRKAPNGFTVGITGSPEFAGDNYWVRFDDGSAAAGSGFSVVRNPNQEGVWRECPQPDTLVNFSPLTLPHRLVRLGHVLQNVFHVSPVVALPSATVTDGGSSTGISTVPWAVTTPGDVAIPAGTNALLRDHNTGVKITLASAATRLTMGFTIDTSLMEAGTKCFVTFYKNSVQQDQRILTGSLGRPLLSAPVTPGTDLGTGDTSLQYRPPIGSGSFDVFGAFAITDVIEVKLTYSGGATPNQYRRVYLTPGDLTLVATGRRVIRFSETDTYPVGAAITVNVDGTPFVYNVVTTPKTGIQVAAALQPTIDADAAIIAALGTPASRIIVSKTNNVLPVVTVTIAFSETTVFNNPTLNMVANEHVGRTLRNLTDGSSGTVTANTPQTVTVGALTGGVDNKFKPGDIISIDGTGTYFTFEPCPWNERIAGDLTIVPFPSFTDSLLTDVVFYQNRLAFTSGENVIMSSDGDFFNFFRYSAVQLFAYDMIDVRSSHKEVSMFHSLVLWNSGLYGISDNAEWEISGTPVLTPTTIRIDPVAKVPNTPGPRPAVVGNRMYLTRSKGGFTQVSEFSASGTTVDKLDSLNITEEIPKYIRGNPLAIVADDTLGSLILLTDADGSLNLYVYSYRFDSEDRQRVQSSWSRWEFGPGQIVGLDLIDGKVGVVSVHAEGVYLTTIDLNVALETATVAEAGSYLDRLVTQATTGVSAAYNGGTNTTTWTLPYSVATNGSEGTLVVVKQNPTVVYTSTRPAANQIAVAGQGDLTAVPVYIGVKYEFRYKPSRIYYRPKDDVPEITGRLILRYLDVFYHDTTDFDVVVTLNLRNSHTYSTAFTLPTNGKKHVPIQGRNEYATIELVNFSPGVCAFSAIRWEGDYSVRSRTI